jgi:hypothetical protein
MGVRFMEKSQVEGIERRKNEVKKQMSTEREMAAKLYGLPCEKANICPSASKACHEPLPYTSDYRAIPGRRWMDCYAWKQMLGLAFIKELGIYHLKQCPCCGQDLIKILENNFENSKT